MRNKVTKAGADYMSMKDCEDIEPYDEKQGYLYCLSQEKGASPRKLQMALRKTRGCTSSTLF